MDAEKCRPFRQGKYTLKKPESSVGGIH